MMRGRAAAVLAVVVAAIFSGTSSTARAEDPVTCVTSDSPYSMQLQALTGPSAADLTVRVAAATGCPLPDALKKIQLKTFAADGTLARTRNLTDVAAPGGVAKAIDLGTVPRARRVDVEVLIQPTPDRTYVLRGTTTTLLRPDLVVESVAPPQTLAGRPVVINAVVGERNGDVGANATVTMSAVPGASESVVVPAGGRVTVAFAPVTFGDPVPVDLTVTVGGADPAESDTTNNTRTATLDVTEHQLPTPRNVLFPSLGGYGAQFGMHEYAPVTPWPTGTDHSDVEAKVKALEPQLVRIFYNENWDGNANGKFPDWQTNYASFVKVVQLAQDAGATIVISYQSISTTTRTTPDPAMAKFADVLEDLVRKDGLTNVRWAEVGNEPNLSAGGVTPDQYNALYRALNAQLVARGLRDQIHLMAGGLVESGGGGNHYRWMKYIGANMNDIVDAYTEHIYWWYDKAGRLEYRLRDIHNLMTNELPPEQRKPDFMMEFGIRGYDTCGTKPVIRNLFRYYLDANCTEIWRTNIAGFQQLWFNIDAAQLGVAGTSKWDAYWSMYDNSSPSNQTYWMIGPPTEGSPLTPTYYAMSLLFHTTAPGWQIIGVEPWESNDWSVPQYGVIGGGTSDDQPEKELVGYAGPSGELTIVGLDTHGRDLNTTSADAPPKYSIGGLPPNTTFHLALWNATGNGTDSIAAPVTTNAAGVARFEVPLQAAFALTTVPVS
jgi:hypothetical protein